MREMTRENAISEIRNGNLQTAIGNRKMSMT